MIKNHLLYFLLLFGFCTYAQNPTGNSEEVGLTEGELSVSLTGSAIYSIPIAVPPGINGVEPKVQLSYSSHAGGGQAGYGWNMAGISKIVRVSSTRYHDNIIDPADFDSSDRFVLDGERLMIKTGSYGGDGAEYQTENFSNIKITSHGISSFGSGPAYFLVQYPDGSRAYYGNQNSTINEWAILYWENPQGARISYSFYSYGNTLYIAAISYGAIGTGTPVNRIEFVYKTKVRPEQGYIGGTSFIQDRLLSEIRVKGNGVGYRNYLLAHSTTSLGHERLVSITEKSGDNTKSYNPTVFTYDNTSESMIYSSAITSLPGASNLSLQNSAVVPGNYDDDERMDFLLYQTIGSSAKTKFYLFRSDPMPETVYDVTFEEVCPVNYLTGDQTAGYKLMPKQGIAIVQQETSQVRISIHAATPSGGLPLQYDRVISNSSIGGDVERKYYAGDFNGDGLTDIMAVVKATGSCYFINLDKRITTGFFNSAGSILAVADDDQIHVADFNGDGRSDLYHFENASMRVITLNENNGYVSLYARGNDIDIKTNRPILMGDYNGDGKADFIIPKDNNFYVKYLSNGLNSGSKVVKTDETYDISYSSTSSTNLLIASDMNKDGKTDLIKVVNPDNSITVSVYKNMESNFVLSTTSTTGTQSPINTFALPIFLNSETPNKHSELAFITNNSIFRFQSNKDFSKDKLLRTIRTAYGVTKTITYSPLADCTTPGCVNVYQEDGTTSTQEFFPNYDIKEAITFNVVSKLEEQSYFQYKQQDYRYLGAVLNYEGRRFLGFKGILRTNWHESNADVISHISKYNIAQRGALTEEHSVQSWGLLSTTYSPTNFIYKSLRTYQSQLMSNKVYKIKNSSTINYNGLEGTSKQYTNTYDTYNNVTYVSHVTKSGSTIEQTGSETYEYYDNPAGPVYYIGRLKRKASSVSHNGDTRTSENQYFYNTAHLLSQKKYRGHNTDYITEDFLYDNFGNVKEKTMSAPGLVPRVEKFMYDTSGRFIIKTTDIDGLVTQNGYNYNTGWLTSTTNPLGITTQYTYDVWGKKIKETDYLGNNTNIVYSVAYNASFPATTTTGDDGSVKFEWYDDLGRIFVSGTKDVDGNFSYVMTSYNIHNQKKTVTQPYSTFFTPSTQLTEYTYDLYGRVTQVSDYTGQTTTHTYSGLTTMTSDGFKNVSVTKNSLGYTTMMYDNGGMVNYKYYADGHLKETDFGGIVTKVVQDGWGRKIQLIDPSAGSYTYTYNHFGDLTKEVTPKGTSTYTLSDTGKLLEKTVVGENTDSKTTYIYDPSTKQLTFKLFEDNIDGFYSEYTYEYDSYKRLWRTSENTFNAFFQRATFFDSFGRPEQLYYGAIHPTTSKSSSQWVKKTYKNGHEWQILDNDTGNVLWEVNTVNEKGNISSASYGNGISIANSYDQYGLPAQSIHTDTATSSNVMTLTTTFEPQRANLTSRSNSLFGWNETFQYDNLDRLTHFTNAAGAQEQQYYDGNGRITANSLGSYNYSSSKPYQHTQVAITEKAKAYYVNREGLYTSTMEEKKGWTHPTPLNMLYDTSKAKTGDYSLRVYNSSSAWVDVYSDAQVFINNTATTQYTISGWVYNNSGKQARLYLVMRSSGMTLTTSYETATTTGQWTYVEKIVNVSPSIVGLNLKVATSGTGYTWFDDIQIRKTSDITTDRFLNISYDVLNNPVMIEETGIDKINFTYHDSGSRYSMYYGSLASNKLARPFRKHYSSDGSIEIKYNTVTGEVEFISYLSGDPYTTPVIARGNGYDSEYLYLHKDYQGSILAISDQDANIIEKRLYDAWGNIIKIESSPVGPLPQRMPIIDRGYTGHEHLMSVNLIHMNGRIYDPQLHRFLQPDNYVQDPYNTQSFNRFGYAFNNPLKYVDINGELSFKQFVAFVAGTIIGIAILFTALGIFVTPFLISEAMMALLGDGMLVILAGAVIGIGTAVALTVLAYNVFDIIIDETNKFIDRNISEPDENSGNYNDMDIYGINQKMAPQAAGNKNAGTNAAQALQLKL